MTQTLHIDPEFKAQIPPLTQDERKQLEENILAEGELLARCFYPAILESFNNEEDQKAFAAWQAEQAHCSAKEKQDVPDGERSDIHTQLFSSWVRPLGRTFLFFSSKSKIGIMEKPFLERYHDSNFLIWWTDSLRLIDSLLPDPGVGPD
ncbi:hypothetical protein [Faecalibacterium sp. An122]|uniref:hypothetical protein n=1 Tax=Faecalibacterium sp. An122 TaxID=1965551 RepID=UPI00194F4216|nr:hypothetical protein [Faecalibacterium sp. An122]